MRRCSSRPGSPPAVRPILQIAEVKALSCQLPVETGTPLSRWSCPELAREVVPRAVAGSISASTVRRWLGDDAPKPWQYRSWIFVRDPNFHAKAARVMGLYARTLDGVPLGEDDYVLSADEKTFIQARCRCRTAGCSFGQRRCTPRGIPTRRGSAFRQATDPGPESDGSGHLRDHDGSELSTPSRITPFRSIHVAGSPPHHP